MVQEQDKRTNNPSDSRRIDVQASGGSIRTDHPAAMAELEGYFGGIDFPVDKHELLRQVEELAGSHAVMTLLERLPDRHYADPRAVNAALAALGEQ